MRLQDGRGESNARFPTAGDVFINYCFDARAALSVPTDFQKNQKMPHKKHNMICTMRDGQCGFCKNTLRKT